MRKKSRRRELIESAWHIGLALAMVAGAVYHEMVGRGRRRGNNV